MPPDPREDDDARPALAEALSTHDDPIDAARAAAQSARASLGAAPDLAIGFVTPPFAQRVGMIADTIRDTLGATHMLLMTASAVMGGDAEIQGRPAVALLAAKLPGVHIHPYWVSSASVSGTDPRIAETLGSVIGVSDSMACSLFFADPFSVPLVHLVPALSASRVSYTDNAGNPRPIGTILGGMASGATTPGHNALFLDGEIRNHGAMGVTLSGPLRVDTIVSQGCRPIGRPMVVTKSRGNLILELSGDPALEAVRASMQGLSDDDRSLLSGGLLLGRVIREDKSRFGRGDFLIRTIMGADEQSGAVAVGDLVNPGQTVQLHLHDARTAREDLALLLDAQRLYERPAGALMISCTGRTSAFFDEPAHDARALRHAFAPTPDGATLAKSGEEIGEDASAIPLAGFFAAGEIGPVGHEIFHHGHTAIAALFRAPETINIK